MMEEKDLERIGSYIKKHLAEWLSEIQVQPSPGMSSQTEGTDRSDRDISMTERIVRVEEGIRHQGILLEKMLKQIEKRFEQVDKRFEQVDKQFERVDKRFALLFTCLTAGFLMLATLISIYHFLG